MPLMNTGVVLKKKHETLMKYRVGKALTRVMKEEKFLTLLKTDLLPQLSKYRPNYCH